MDRRIIAPVALALGLVVACMGSSTGLPEDGSGTGNGNSSSDLPCEVAAVLSAHCTSCHGATPSNGATGSLTSLAALRAPSHSNPSKTVGQLSVERMASPTGTMPPVPAASVPASEQATFSAWVSAGMPAGSCGAPWPDAGTIDPGGGPGGGSDAGVSGDLPCDIAGILSESCTRCHGSPPSGGATTLLDSLATLHAASVSEPGKSTGQVAVERMASSTRPMPPPPAAPVSAAKQATFASWVGAGMDAGTCGAPTPDAGPGTGPDGGGNVDAGVSGDLPCDVAALLTSHCTLCHGTPPAGGATDSLNSLAALLAPSISQPTKSVAQVAVLRMASTTTPMPPLPAAPVPAAEQAAFASWVSAGTPAGTCGAPTPDGGPPPDPVFTAPPTCTSGTYWSGGEESAQMDPGRPCIACHALSNEAPTFAVAGTVYPTGHEYDNCYGTAAAGAMVVVTDADGVARTFTVNPAGNFSGRPSGAWPTFPITAEVHSGGSVRAMSTPVFSGDCNGCHTEAGDGGAPGRVALP